MRILFPLIFPLAVGFGSVTFAARARADSPQIMCWDRVASVAFEAELANWDADAAPDGLAIFVQPIDAWGAPVPACGIVQVELVAAMRRDFVEVPHGRGAACQTLGRWTKNLATSLPTAQGYLVKLPFPAGFQSHEDVVSDGRLHLRLVVPGQGVFEAALGGIDLLP